MKNLDKKDKRMLLELYKNGRASVTEIASRIGLSKEATNYRLKRLQNEGVLIKIIPIIDFSALGYSTYRVQILLTPEGKVKKSELEQNMIKIKSLSWLVKLSGAWDYAFLFNSRSNLEFSEAYETFINQYGKYIDKKISSMVFSITHFPLTYLFDGERKGLKQEMKVQNFDIDENQKKIIDLLEQDGRMSLLEMARRMNLSLSTIKYHLQLLEKKKIIFGYKPLINIGKFDYEQFKVNIELADPSQKNKLIELLSSNNNVVYITDAWGKFDLEYECQYRNIHELLQSIDLIEKQVHIKKYELIFTNEEVFVNGMPND